MPLDTRWVKACSDALAIVSGACNSSGVARTMLEVLQLCRELAPGEDVREHGTYAPYRQILSQLHFLGCLGDGSYHLWDRDNALCHRAVEEDV